MSNVSISVVLASYNAYNFIKSSIDSILNQTIKVKEIIVVDDGSSDQTLEILSEYERDNKITLIKKLHTGNVGRLLNEGIKLSKGEFVGIMAADDVWEKNKIEEQLRYVHEYKMTCTDAKIINGENQLISESHFNGFNSDVDFDLTILLMHNYVLAPSVLIERDTINECGYFDEEIGIRGEDYILWLKVAERYKIRFINKPLLLYRRHSKNLSSYDFEERCELLKRTIDIRLNYITYDNPDVVLASKIGCGYIYGELVSLNFHYYKFRTAQTYLFKLLKIYHRKLSYKFLKFLTYFIVISTLRIILGDRQSKN